MIDIYENFQNDENNIDYNDEEEFEENDNHINVFKGSIFIHESEINVERENKIKEAMENFNLKREDSILVMIYLQWNLDKSEIWYDNVEENRIKAGIDLSKEVKEQLKKEKIESNGNYCLICYEKKDENNNFYSLNCGHQFCEECWTGYLKEKIKFPLNALQVKCPQKFCTCIVYEKLYSKFLKDENSLGKLNKAIYTNFIERNQDIKQCPNEYCHYYLKTNDHFAREINCICGTSYCFKCSKESHTPIPCDMFNKWNKLKVNNYFYLNSEEEKSDKWIQANTKECPMCHLRIEKSRGCNYMLCDKKVGGCGYAFCYVCETEWSKHSDDHFFCNKYQSEEVKKKEKNAEKLKEDLEIELIEEEFLKLEMNFGMNKRLYFYYSRYKNYKESIEICNSSLKKELEEKIGILNAIHYLNSEDVNLIRDAVETVIKTKNILKNSYIFGYYMKNNEQKKKFVKSQGNLEYRTENLHKLLIDEQLNIIIESYSDNFNWLFYKYKNSLKSLIDTITKNRESFIEEIECNYISDLDENLIDY